MMYMFCKNCGKEQKEGQKFCPQCGTPFITANDDTANAKVNHAVNNDGSNESAPEKEKNKVDSQNSDSIKVEEIPEPKLELVQPKVAIEASVDNPENITLNEEEVKSYGKWKNGLKWGGLVMAIFLGGGSLSDFSWFSFILYAALCYLVYNAFFGKEEGKTLADFNLLKFKSFACLGVCLMLVMCGHGGGNVRGDSYDELKSIVKESGKLTEDEAKVLVVMHIKSNMHNPDSYQSVSWSGFKKWGDGGWRISHTFRGTNGFGGTITETHLYQINDDLWVITVD